MIGGTGTILMLLFMVGFLIVDLVAAQPNPYIGVFTFLVFPVLTFLFAAMAVIGLMRSRLRLKREFGNGATYHFYPHLDFTNRRHRRFLTVAAGGIALIVPTIGVLSYQGYHYTDSNQFCGAVCHSVMEPQYVAYQHSSHARVGCVECHIGSGASWYVKSKLSGIRQVFAVALDTYPRPIPPAIQELRPATETCRTCHWPAKFFGDQLVSIDHFASDETNTHSRIRMLLKTGGSDPSTGPPSGIHWHMALGFRIEYVAGDKQLQNIPWVKMTDQTTGRQAVYRSDGLPTSDPPPDGIHRTVDCMDCHNRPTHIFRSPDRAVDTALNIHSAFQTLPFAKREMVAALSRHYETKEQGLAGVTNSLAAYYEHEHPEIWQKRKADIDQLVLTARELYSTSFFPEMNVSWRTYPNNIGHRIYPGCFRCHDGLHKDEKGDSIARECNTCHEFITPADHDGVDNKLVGIGGFKHPVELEGAHATMRCDRCHTGGPAPQATCAGCHSTVAEFRAGTLSEFKRFGISADPMAASVECKDCHDLGKPLTLEVMNEKCMDCHGDEKEKFDGMLAGWKTEVEQQLGSLSRNPDPGVQSILSTLRKAGPFHNMEGTRSIVRRLGGGSPTADSPTSKTESQ